MKPNIFIFLSALFISNLSYGQLRVKLDGEEIETSHTYNYFFCPSNINIEHPEYDSLQADVTVSYIDLVSEEAVSQKFMTAYVDINPTGKLTASMKCKEQPIVIELNKIYGFRKGKKFKLDITDKVYTIIYGSSRFKNDTLFTRINSNSKLSLSIDGKKVEGNQVSLSDSIKQWKILCPEGMKIISGELMTVLIMTKGAPRPTRSLSLKSEEELNSELRKILSGVSPGHVIMIKAILKNNDGTVLEKKQSMIFEFR
jgi:hypothetical protein